MNDPDKALHLWGERHPDDRHQVIDHTADYGGAVGARVLKHAHNGAYTSKEKAREALKPFAEAGRILHLYGDSLSSEFSIWIQHGEDSIRLDAGDFFRAERTYNEDS